MGVKIQSVRFGLDSVGSEQSQIIGIYEHGNKSSVNFLSSRVTTIFFQERPRTMDLV